MKLWLVQIIACAILVSGFIPALVWADVTTEQNHTQDQQPLRIMQLDLDYIYDPNSKQEQRNLNKLIERVQALHVNTIYLQGFADPHGTRLASALYFPNQELPVREDLFAKVVHRLKDQTGAKVYGWLPVLSFDLGSGVDQVMMWDDKLNTAVIDPKAYHRLSVFDPSVRDRIIGIYEDMAMSAPIDGLLFHDDATLSDFEDASPSALRAYQQAGLPNTIEALRDDEDVRQEWTKFKSDALVHFTQEIAQHVRIVRGEPIKTARNIYARVVLDGDSSEWFAQKFEQFLTAYDYTAIMAMPRMEDVPAEDAEAWLGNLAQIARSADPGLQHTIFELQSVDWRLQMQNLARAVPADEFAGQVRLLSGLGVKHLGYYPEDFVANTPDVEKIAPDFSLQAALITP